MTELYVGDYDALAEFVGQSQAREASGRTISEPLDASAGEVIGAALRRNNLLVAEMMRLSPDRFPIDPSFDLYAQPNWDRYRKYTEAFAEVHSQEAYKAVTQRLDEEFRQLQVLREAGIWGFAAEMAAAVSSPESLIPVGGLALGRHLRTLQGVVTGAASAGAVTYASGEALRDSVLTRTPEESEAEAVFASLLGGALGGVLARKMPDEISRLTDDMQAGDAPVNAPNLRGLDWDLPDDELAEKIAQRFEEANPDDSRLVGDKVLRRLRPITRLISPALQLGSSSLRAVRRAARQLSDDGLLRVDAGDGPAVTSQVQLRLGAANKLVQSMKGNYQQYRKGAGKDAMTFDEFDQLVAIAQRRGGRFDELDQVDPELSKWIGQPGVEKHVIRAQTELDKFLGEYHSQLLDLGLISEAQVEATSRTARGHLTRQWSPGRVAAQRDDLRENVLIPWLLRSGDEMDRAVAGRIADDIIATLERDPTVRDAPFHRFTSKAGPFEDRVLDIPDNEIERFLEPRATESVFSFVRTVAPRVELARRYRSTPRLLSQVRGKLRQALRGRSPVEAVEHADLDLREVRVVNRLLPVVDAITRMAHMSGRGGTRKLRNDLWRASEAFQTAFAKVERAFESSGLKGPEGLEDLFEDLRSAEQVVESLVKDAEKFLGRKLTKSLDEPGEFPELQSTAPFSDESRDVLVEFSEGVRNRLDDIRRADATSAVEMQPVLSRARADRAEMVKRLRERGASEGAIRKAEDRADQDIKLVMDARDLLLGQHRYQGADNLFVRGSARTRKWLFATKLGSVVLSSLSDVGSIILQVGLRDTFTTFASNLGGVVKGLVQVPAGRKLSILKTQRGRDEATDLIASLEAASETSRAFELHELTQYGASGSRNAWDARFFDPVSDAAAAVYGLDRWNTLLSSFTSLAIHNKISRILSKKSLTRSDLNNLKLFGLDEDLVERVRKQFGNGERVRGQFYPRTELWDDELARDSYIGAVRQEVNRTVLRPSITDRPIWSTDAFGSLIASFRSFAFAATGKLGVASLQRRDAQVAVGLPILIAFGAASYTLREVLAGRDPELDKPGVLIREGIDRSGVGGILTEAFNIFDANVGLTKDTPFGASRVYRRDASDVISPAIGLADDVLRVGAAGTRAALGEELTQGEIRRARQTMVPVAGVYWLRRIVEAIEEEGFKKFDIPERRER